MLKMLFITTFLINIFSINQLFIYELIKQSNQYLLNLYFSYIIILTIHSYSVV